MMRKRYTPTFKAQVVRELLREEKTLAQLAAEHGVHPTQLITWRTSALEGLPSLFTRQNSTSVLKTDYEARLATLYEEVGRLAGAWCLGSKENLVSSLPDAERRVLLERGTSMLPLSVQADLLGISRSSLYYQPRQPSIEEVTLKHRIDALYTQYPFYSSRRITAQLRRDGLIVNRKAVQRHMREMGIAGICPGPNLSRRVHGAQVYPYLLRNLTCRYPNQVWGIDVTYIPLQTGWMYLVAVLDWFSRYVISWELDDTLQAPFVLEAVKRALEQATPEIWNSDQGSHFTSPQYRDLLRAAGVQISMDGKGRALGGLVWV